MLEADVISAATSQNYSTSDVARLAQIQPGKVRALVRAGVLMPERDAKNRYRFRFQDLVFLRGIERLRQRISNRRLHRLLRRLQAQLPEPSDLSQVNLLDEGKAVFACDRTQLWEPESGQLCFDFEALGQTAQAKPNLAPLRPLATRQAQPARCGQGQGQGQTAGDKQSAEFWYESGCDWEGRCDGTAVSCYRRALALDGSHLDARINLGRLLQEKGDCLAALKQYDTVLKERPNNATAAFNVGVACEDLGWHEEALKAYQLAMHNDPRFSDAYFNASRLSEQLGKRQEALRLLGAYRRLTGGRQA